MHKIKLACVLAFFAFGIGIRAVGAPGSISPVTFERIMFNEGEPKASIVDGKIELF